MGHGAVAAFSLYPYFKIIRSRSADARAGYDHRARLKGHSRHNMDHQGPLYRRIFQQPCPDHVRRAFKDLLRRLKHELYRAAYVLLMPLQQARRAQQHGRVHIMAAGVHGAIGRSKIHLRLFLNGQCVHICPEQKHLSRFFPSHHGHQARTAAKLRRTAHLLQLGLYIGQGIIQRKACFRMGVQILSLLNGLIFPFSCFLFQFLCVHKGHPPLCGAPQMWLIISACGALFPLSGYWAFGRIVAFCPTMHFICAWDECSPAVSFPSAPGPQQKKSPLRERGSLGTERKISHLRQMASISTSAPLGRAPTSTALRAG